VEKRLLGGIVCYGQSTNYYHGSTGRIIYVWKSVSTAEFFWLCLLEKQWFSEEQVQQSYAWVLSTFDAGTPQSTIERLYGIWNISRLLVAAQLCYATMKRYARGNWRFYDTDTDAWVFAILLCVLPVIAPYATSRITLLEKAAAKGAHLRP
jgi:hypothetical protein